MEERELRSRVTWIVGLLLATVFVGTIVWSVAQDSDDDGGSHDESLTFNEVGEAIDPSIAVPLESPSTTELSEATLTVDPDGCGVYRSMLPVDPDGLTWVIKDVDGFEVLSRNAVGETQYRYFEPGTFTVTLQAWDGEAYVPISTTVDISC